MERFPKSTRVLLAVLLLIVLQGPLALLQLTAWGGMLVDHSRSGSVLVAIEKTFNGENPCPLCLTIQDVQAKQSPSALNDHSQRSILLLFGRAQALRCGVPPYQWSPLSTENFIAVAQTHRVATPPPKVPYWATA